MNSYASLATPKMKVLVVEDEPIWQLLILKALRRMNDGVEVCFSETANEALGAIKKSDSEQFDLIIADQILEGAKTGLDLWDILFEQKSEIPYVLLSGFQKRDFFQALMPYRVERVPYFIEKPQSVSELSQKLSEAFFDIQAPIFVGIIKKDKSTFRM